MVTGRPVRLLPVSWVDLEWPSKAMYSSLCHQPLALLGVAEPWRVWWMKLRQWAVPLKGCRQVGFLVFHELNSLLCPELLTMIHCAVIGPKQQV
jgi:hypothetical protein